MSKVCAIGKVVALPGKRDAMLNALSKLVENAKNEPGTPVYAIHTERDDDSTLWFYEVFESDEALRIHSSAADKLVRSAVQQYAAAEPEIHILTPEMHKGY